MHQIQKDLLSLSRNINLGERSLREIGRLIGVEHPQKIQHHLRQLEKKGFLIVDKSNGEIKNINHNTSLEQRFVNIPIVGAANCGPAQLLAVENIEGHLKLSKSIVKKENLFAVKAEGDSMNRANISGSNIESGDFVLIDKEDQLPEHGKYILAVVDGAANIKRLYKDTENNRIALLSESSKDYPPIYVHEDDYSDFMVNGTVVQIIKQMSF